MKNNSALILGTILISLCNTSIAENLYKWVDRSGNVFFSDKVTPKDSHRKLETLNNKGWVINTKEAAKTPFQIKQFKEIKELQKTQRSLLKEQLERDTALLKTFRNESDIDTLANSKFEIIRSNISLATTQSDIAKKQIVLHQKTAARFERQGKQIPKKTINKLRSAQAQLSKSKQDIVNFKQQERDVTKQFTDDKARLKSLQSLTSKNPEIHLDTTPHLSLGTLPCKNNDCMPLWKKAHAFVISKNSPSIFSSVDLILTKKPTLRRDRGLSLTKVQKGSDAYIIMDIRCANSKGGRETCSNEKTASLITEFNQLDH